MSNDIEEGELNSDNDDSNTIKFDTELNESSTNANNPYDEEDEMMLELKIKALQSLLEKSGDGEIGGGGDQDDETIMKKRSKKVGKQRRSKLKIFRNRRSASSSTSNTNKKYIETNEEFIEMQQTTSKLPSLLSIQTTYPANNFINRPNIRLMQATTTANNNNNNSYYDNYELQDMDIETNTSSLPLNMNNNYMQPMSTSYLQQQQQQQPFSNNFLNDQIKSIYNPEFLASWSTSICNLMASVREFNHSSNFEYPTHQQQQPLLSSSSSLNNMTSSISPLLSLKPQYQPSPSIQPLRSAQSSFARRQNLRKSPFKKKQQQQRNNNKNFNRAKPNNNNNNNSISIVNKELTSPTSTSSGQMTSPGINNKISSKSNMPSSLMDYDQRCSESSATKASNEEKLIEEEKLLREILINSIKKNQEKKLVIVEQQHQQQQSNQKEEEEEKKNEKDDEKEMQQLRLKLLDNLSQKRKEKEQLQEKQMDQDFSLLKRKLIEHEQELVNNQKTEKATTTTTTTSASSSSNVFVNKQRKINPVIIHLNSPETDQETTSDGEDNDDDQVEKKTSGLIQQNIGLFLKEAKQQAQQILVPISVNNQKNEIIVPKTSKHQLVSSENEEKKLVVVKSLRDKINLNSKEINDLTKKSLELKQIKLKKDKDIELTKQKITTLREQLIAAEKILNANEAAANLVKLQQKSTDLKLIKLISIKKTQQLQLQKLLATTSTAVTVAAAPVVNKRIVLQPEASKTPPQLSPTPPPPLPTQPPPPLPPLPPMPESTQINYTQPPTPSVPTTTLNKLKQDSSEFLMKKALPVQMTLGGVVAATAGSKKKSTNFNKYSLSNNMNMNNNTNSVDSITRPNLFTSKQTDKKLEQLAAISNINDQNEMNKKIINSKIVDINKGAGNSIKSSPFKLRNGNSLNNNNNCKKLTSLGNNTNLVKNSMKQETKQIESLHIEKKKNYSNSHCESLDIWCFESTTNSMNLKDFKPIDFSLIEIKLPQSTSNQQQHSTNHFSLLQAKNEKIHIIDDVSNYESPLKCFKGYRFSSHFTKLNPIEEAYSKFYCNAIDFRRPFCPFDLHGSCKDSNCVYQHFNVMTMDNFQRTEHLLSYCPQILGLSSQNATSKEAIKKLKAYAQTFMNNNLGKMSIKDYFQYLYDHIILNLKLEPSYSTILSRTVSLCLNNNRSLGINDHFTNNNSSNNRFTKSESLIHLFETLLSVNIDRSLEIKLKNLESNSKLDIDWLKIEQEKPEYLETSDQVLFAWLFYCKQIYAKSCIDENNNDENNSIQKLLNVLSHSLELNPKCELIWLIYLKTYMTQTNAYKDYHEICLLCMDNLITYDLVWFMLNTCPNEYLNLIIERYENFLLSLNSEKQLNEFEQYDECDSTTLTKCSFYLFELIVFNCSLNQVDNKSEKMLLKYLRTSEIVNKLEANDLCLLWLCAIHLEAFSSFPSMIRTHILFNCRVIRYFNTRLFWSTISATRKQRNFNHKVFNYLNLVYKQRATAESTTGSLNRQLDSFLLPWNFKKLNQSTYDCSIEQLQSLFHEALKSINTRLSHLKQKARLNSIPLYINLICLEISNKRNETASRLCERLLNAESLKELWLSQIYIQRCSLKTAATVENEQEINDTISNVIKASTGMFPLDAQLIFVSAQYFSLNNKREKSIELIESLIKQFYLSHSSLDESLSSIDFIFKILLSLDSKKEEAKKFENIDLIKLSAVKNDETQLIGFALIYCYYLQLLNVDESSNELICKTYEIILKNLGLISHRAILWTSYFKFLASSSTSSSSSSSDSKSYSEMIFSLIKKCLKDLNELLLLDSATSSHLIIPFFYHNHNNNNLRDNKLSTNNNYLETEFEFEFDSCYRDYYYHNCLIDLWLKLFARNLSDKYSLVKYLIDLMPFNIELVKLFINYGTKLNGSKVTLQLVYDHLIINSISNEHIWILCIKLCMDSNDLPQAILIFQKAEQICKQHRSNLYGLNKLIPYLFPTNDINIKNETS